MNYRLLLCSGSRETDVLSILNHLEPRGPFAENRADSYDCYYGQSERRCRVLVLRELPLLEYSLALYCRITLALEGVPLLMIVGQAAEEPPESLFDEFPSGIVVSNRVVMEWNLINGSIRRIKPSEDGDWFLVPADAKSESHQPHDARSQLENMRSIPFRSEDSIEPQAITITLTAEESLDSLSQVAYQDVVQVSNETKGVGGRNALLITSMERSGLSMGGESRNDTRPGMSTFTFHNAAACGLRYVPPREGGTTIVERLMDGKVALVCAEGGTVRRMACRIHSKSDW